MVTNNNDKCNHNYFKLHTKLNIRFDYVETLPVYQFLLYISSFHIGSSTGSQMILSKLKFNLSLGDLQIAYMKHVVTIPYVH